MTTQYQLPAKLIADIKKALIDLGYANSQTSDAVIQDAYFKYVMVRQTGTNPLMPYALDLLPQELRDRLSGGDDDTPIGGGDDTPIENEGFYTLQRTRYTEMVAPVPVVPVSVSSIADVFIAYMAVKVGVEFSPEMPYELFKEQILMGHAGIEPSVTIEADAWVDDDSVSHIRYHGSTPQYVAPLGDELAELNHYRMLATKNNASGVPSTASTLLVNLASLQPMMDSLGITLADILSRRCWITTETVIYANGFDQPPTDSYDNLSQLDEGTIDEGVNYFALTTMKLSMTGKYNRIVLIPALDGTKRPEATVNIDIVVEHDGYDFT